MGGDLRRAATGKSKKRSNTANESQGPENWLRCAGTGSLNLPYANLPPMSGLVLHTDDGVRFGVTVPDLPGCFSAGDTLDEALDSVIEAIDLHLEGVIEGGGDTALRLSRALGMSADFWLGLQQNWDLWNAMNSPEAKQINRLKPLSRTQNSFV